VLHAIGLAAGSLAPWHEPSPTQQQTNHALRDEVQNLVQEAAPALPADVQGQRLVAGMWQACSSILSLRL